MHRWVRPAARPFISQKPTCCRWRGFASCWPALPGRSGCVMPRDNLPLELLEQLDPVQVKSYAKATGWVREPRLGDGVIAVYAHPTSDLDQIIIPLIRGAYGFSR